MKAPLIVIPSRYGSTRFPGKSLALINGKPLVQWVWEAACRSKLAGGVVVATDDERILEAVSDFGGRAVMTRKSHASGTDRLAEVANKIPAPAYINVQGDEPLMKASVIDALIQGLAKHEMATMAHRIESEEEWRSPEAVKVVFDRFGQALYFSRSPLPFLRAYDPRVQMWRHIGIYAYRAAALKKFVAWSRSALEKAESLEQLRALDNGMRIQVICTTLRCVGVDTPADVTRVEKLLRGKR